MLEDFIYIKSLINKKAWCIELMSYRTKLIVEFEFTIADCIRSRSYPSEKIRAKCCLKRLS